MGLFTLYNTVKLDADGLTDYFKKFILTKKYESIREEIKTALLTNKWTLVLDTPDGKYSLHFVFRAFKRGYLTAWIRDNTLKENKRTTIYELSKRKEIEKFKSNITMLLTTGYYAPDESSGSDDNNVADTPIHKEPSVISAADEIMKYKELLDNGIITQEEFEIKRAEFKNNMGIR